MEFESVDTFRRAYYAHLRSKPYVTFSSGGVNGLSMFGAMMEMCEHDSSTWHRWIDGVKGFGGISVGAMLATAMVCNPEPQVLRKLVQNFPTEDIMQREFPFESPTLLFEAFQQRKGGVMAGTVLTLIASIILHQFVGNPSITFEQLHNITRKELRIEAVRWKDCAKVLFSERTTPDIPVLLALRASTSVPLMFEPARVGGVHFIDGGVRNQNALDLFPGCASKTLSVLVCPHNLHTSDNEVPGFGLAAQKLCGSVWAECTALQMHSLPAIVDGMVVLESSDSVESLSLHKLDANTVDQLIRDGAQAQRAWSLTRWILFAFSRVVGPMHGAHESTGHV